MLGGHPAALLASTDLGSVEVDHDVAPPLAPHAQQRPEMRASGLLLYSCLDGNELLLDDGLKALGKIAKVEDFFLFLLDKAQDDCKAKYVLK